jgi:photosystem II stability/assembly factor-like uncharacterized protein
MAFHYRNLPHALLRSMTILLLALSAGLTAHPVQAADSDTQLVSPLLGPCSPAARAYQHAPNASFSPQESSGMRMQLVEQFEETSYYVNDVSFVSATIGWAAGDTHWDSTAHGFAATILKTTDGGLTWSEQSAAPAQPLEGIDFVDASQGGAVGDGGTVLHTADGGVTWAGQTIATTDDIHSVDFANRNEGWVTTLRATHQDWMGDNDNWVSGVWHTTNGGTTWTQQTVPAGTSILHDIFFLDNQLGWAVGVKYTGEGTTGPEHQGMVYHTANGGATWSEQSSPWTPFSITSAFFRDALHGWVTGFPTSSGQMDGSIYYTADGGATWTKQLDAHFFAPLWNIQFIDANRGYATGFDYASAWGTPVWRTLDGGATWREIRMDHNESDGIFGLYLSENMAVGLGDHDFVIRSTDPWGDYGSFNGEDLFTQYFISTHYTFEDVVFTDANNGWVAGRRSYAPEFTGQVILHTADGGVTWSTQHELAPSMGPTDLFSDLTLRRLAFSDTQHGWAVGMSENKKGAIYHTNDGGGAWVEQGQSLYGSTYDLDFLDLVAQDAQNAWAIADWRPDSGNINLIHTTDGGEHWNWVDTGVTSINLINASYRAWDAQHAWMTSGFSLAEVYYTVNGGTSWSKSDFGKLVGNMYAMDATSSQSVWVAGEGVFHSTDGGATFTEVETGMGNMVYDLDFIDADHGFLTGDYGATLYTTDGGSSWSAAKNTAWGATLNGLSFVSAEKGWLAGEAGVILTTTWVPYGVVYLPMIKR